MDCDTLLLHGALKQSDIRIKWDSKNQPERGSKYKCLTFHESLIQSKRSMVDPYKFILFTGKFSYFFRAPAYFSDPSVFNDEDGCCWICCIDQESESKEDWLFKKKKLILHLISQVDRFCNIFDKYS